jgi:hypothetical protein
LTKMIGWNATFTALVTYLSTRNEIYATASTSTGFAVTS